MDADICLRCGAPYTPGQTVCFKCGAPLGETRPNTQPVPVIKIPQPEPPAEPEPLPTPPRAGRVTAAPTISEPSATPAAKRKRRWPLLALIVALVLAAIGGGAYLVRALTAAPPVATQTLYRDPQHRFRFERPTLWTVTTTADGVTITDSTGASTARVTVDPADPAESAQAHADVMAKELGLSAAPEQTIGGDTWEQRTGQVTGADGAVRQTVIYVTLHNGLIYIIQVSSPVASFTSVDNLVYQPLLASFQFS